LIERHFVDFVIAEQSSIAGRRTADPAREVADSLEKRFYWLDLVEATLIREVTADRFNASSGLVERVRQLLSDDTVLIAASLLGAIPGIPWDSV